MKTNLVIPLLLLCSAAIAQLNITVNSQQYYVVPNELLGVNTLLFPDFLEPAPPCSKCETLNTDSPCVDPTGIACDDTTNCAGIWRTHLPDRLEGDVDALHYKSLYYPEGVVSRYYHYVPGGHGFCINPLEADLLSQWAINSGKTVPEVWKRYCNENTYGYANFFEKNIDVAKNEGSPSESMHTVISANVYFGSWQELKSILEYCAGNGVIVDAIVFGTEIEHDQDNVPSMILHDGDTIPFASGGSYFNRVQHVFIDSIKSHPSYAHLPLYFAAGIQHGGQGGCNERTYECDDTMGTKSLWNRQIHDAIKNYNLSHSQQLAYAGAVNWWWVPMDNDTLNPSSDMAINDMNAFFDVGLSGNGLATCYKYPGTDPQGEITGFDEIMIVQWGVKKNTSTCVGAGYENKFITQLYIVKRVLNMLENNFNVKYNPAASNGLTYTNAFFQRLGSNSSYNPIDLDPDSGSWNVENISKYAIHQVNTLAGYKFRRATIENGPAKNLEAYYFFNCNSQKLFIINYSDTAFTINNLFVNASTYTAGTRLNYLETSVADTSVLATLAPFSETKQAIPHNMVPLQNILIPPYGIIEIELPYMQSPGMEEVCNGIDDDCDSEIDEGVTLTYYADADGDSFGNAAFPLTTCTAPAGYVSNNTDCNDLPVVGATIYPGAIELCNNLDDNCNNVIDDNALLPTITPSGTVTMCSNASVTLTASGGPGITYQWLKNNKNISGATNQTYLAKVAATFQVSETNTLGCTGKSAGVTVVVYSLPSAVITPLGDLNICVSGSVVLQANAGSGLLYQWKKGVNLIAGATNQHYTATAVGTYKVTVTNSNGCSKISTGTKVIKSCKESGDSASWGKTVFSCYPNPTDGMLVITLKSEPLPDQRSFDEVLLQIEIRDVLGKLVYDEKVVMQNGDLKHPVSFAGNASSGIYWVRMVLPEKTFQAMVVYQQ